MSTIYTIALIIDDEIQWMNHKFFSTKIATIKDIAKRVDDGIRLCENIINEPIATRWDTYKINECGKDTYLAVEAIAQLRNTSTGKKIIYGVVEYSLD